MITYSNLEYSLKPFTNGRELLNSSEEYDLLLLDIDMPDLNGFEIADQLHSALKYSDHLNVIYISNYENLVFESFKYSPLRFVRKKNLSIDLEEAIVAWLNKYLTNNEFFVFTDKTTGNTVKIRIEEICYFEAYGHDISLIDESKKIYNIKRNTTSTLNHLEEKLSHKGFLRSHKSYLVNYRHIYKITDNKIYFSNGLMALITIKKLRNSN